MTRWLPFLSIILLSCAYADGPKDNIPDSVRPIPPPGIEVSAEQKAKLESKMAELKQAIDALRQKDDKTRELIPDVEIFYRAAHDALVYHEFIKPQEIDQALSLLDLGKSRAAELTEGKASWTTQTGLVVRGYVSRLDGSVQPYGMWIPESYSFTGASRYRLDIWFHGRVEYLTETFFLNLRMTKRDQIEVYAPRDTVVLYPYGRFCTASKFAGEVDAFEALASVQQRYRIDDDRISVRGFSMGGAATWHFAVHHADRWFAANPGAGFAETQHFLDFFQGEKLDPKPWQRKLWNMYDADKYALNLSQCPTIAYSGEIDKQKQAADLMADALRGHGIDLVHIVAPKTAHKVQLPEAHEVEVRMEALAQVGRRHVPNTIAFETYTLKYNRMNWVTIDGIDEHWSRAEVRASISAPAKITVKNTHVSALTLSMNPGDSPWEAAEAVTVSIDGQDFNVSPRSDRSFHASFYRDGGTWKLGARVEDGLRKKQDLQGPIDDAFLNAFIFVKPTGQAMNELAGKWSLSEMQRAIEQWRKQFRGYAIVKDDTAVTDDDIQSKNLIVWGDPSSNAFLKKIADKLPISWKESSIIAGAKKWDASNHSAILIYPNPLNPAHYVVLNSGFTYREYAYLNNARQVPMLPDWAIVDLTQPPDTIWPGKIEDAGFFDEQWRLKE